MEKEWLIQLGKRIRELRLERNLTQLDLSIESDLDKNYIGMIERAERNPSFTSLKKLANSLNISLSELLKGI